MFGIRDDITVILDREYEAGLEEREGRKKRFSTIYPNVDKIPAIGRATKGLYAQGAGSLVFLILILILFTALKAPYFSLPFTGEHSTKYNTYVEPALYMSQYNNPLLYMKKYVADPVTNPDGIYSKFDHLPLFEWGLFSAYKVLPFGNLETKTRIFTHFIGLAILVFAYIFFLQWLPPRLTLLSVALMSINPIILFGTYVTVLDSLLILLMFISFILLNSFFNKRNLATLFWAGIIFGVGNAVKYSLILWMAPISMLLIYCKKDNVVDFLYNYFIYGLLSILMVVTFKTSINQIIGRPMQGLLSFAAWVFFYWGFYRFLKKYESIIRNFVGNIVSNRMIFLIISLCIAIGGVVVFKYFNLGDYGKEYLTDSTLLFNYQLYKYMLFIQFKNYMTRTFFWIGITGFLLVFGIADARSRNVVFSFLFGSAIYWVIASKAIFFHNYYTMIFMISFSVGAAFTIYYFFRNMTSPAGKIVVALLFSVLILPGVHDEAEAKMGRYDRVTEVIKFIGENTNPGDFIMYEGWLSPLVMYTGRGFVKPATLESDRIREEIREFGFAETMKKYRIKYFFSPNEKPFYKDFAPLFAKTNIIEPGGKTYNRNIFIHKTIGNSAESIEDDLKEIEEIERKYRIPDKFKLAEKVGRYKFYTFLN